MRIEACAVILMADKSKKVYAYAEKNGVDPVEASVRYVIGALKSAKRRGSARNYAEALEQFERDQDGDNAVSVSMTSTLTADVRKIEKRNDSTYTRIINGHAEIVGKVKDTEARSHKRNIAKVIGALYVQAEDFAEAYTAEAVYNSAERNARIERCDSLIASYMGDYVSRLSPTARASLRMVIDSTMSADAIARARDDDGGKMRERARYLHGGFPARDAISVAEFIDIARKYCA